MEKLVRKIEVTDKPYEKLDRETSTAESIVSREESVFKLLRIAHGLSKAELAKKLECSPTLVAAVENGQRKISRSLLEKMAVAYEMKDIHIFYLLNEYEVNDDFSDMEIEPSCRVYRKELLNILDAISALE